MEDIEVSVELSIDSWQSDAIAHPLCGLHWVGDVWRPSSRLGGSIKDTDDSQVRVVDGRDGMDEDSRKGSLKGRIERLERDETGLKAFVQGPFCWKKRGAPDLVPRLVDLSTLQISRKEQESLA